MPLVCPYWNSFCSATIQLRLPDYRTRYLEAYHSNTLWFYCSIHPLLLESRKGMRLRPYSIKLSSFQFLRSLSDRLNICRFYFLPFCQPLHRGLYMPWWPKRRQRTKVQITYARLGICFFRNWLKCYPSEVMDWWKSKNIRAGVLRVLFSIFVIEAVDLIRRSF